MRIHQTLTLIPRRMRFTREMFERFGLTAQCLGCRATWTGVGYPANHSERCRDRIEHELEKEPEGASKVARDRERIKRARHEEGFRDVRIEDPDQRLDPRSSKELARQALVMVLEISRHYAQLNRVSVLTSQRTER